MENNDLTVEETALVRLFEYLGLDQTSTIGLLLLLHEREDGAKLMIEFLKKSNPQELTESRLIEEALKITGRTI